MGWSDVLAAMAGKIAKGGVNFTIKNVHRAGSLTSLFGGAGISFAQSLHKPVDAAYYADGSAEGKIKVNGTMVNSGAKIYFELPINTTFIQEGNGAYNVDVITDPEWVELISTCLIGVGISLRILAGLLEKLYQHWEDKKEYPLQKEFYLHQPSKREYAYNIAGSFTEAATLVLLGHSIMTVLVNYTSLFGSEQDFHYPEEGQLANGTYYQGPLATGERRVILPLEEAVVPIWRNISALFRIVIDGDVRFVYGGGLHIMPSKQRLLPAPAAITMDLGLALIGDNLHSFFGAQAEKERRKRISECQAGAERYDEKQQLLCYGAIQ